MKIRIAACLTAGALAVSMSVGVASASGVNFPNAFNSANTIYNSLENVDTSHNGLLKHVHGSCSAFKKDAAHKWWVYKAKKDAAAIKSVEKTVSTATKKQRGRKMYRDFVRTNNNLMHWANVRIRPQLLVCTKLPVSNPNLDQDMSSLQTDLNQGNY